MASYQDSPELLAVGLKVVDKNHPDLKSINVGYLFRDAAPISRGRITLGMAVKVDDRNYVYGGKDVIIEIGRDVWDQMDDELREVLIDHELCHIGVDLDEKGNTVLTNNGRPKVFIKPHDIEEFQIILDRYGEVHRKYRKAVEAMQAVVDAQRKDKTDAADPSKKG